jgi:chromosome segregation ATPase
MMRRPPLLITLPALLGLLHTAALADAGAPPELAPRTGPGPTAPDLDVKATLDELTARVQQLSHRAGDTAELTETLLAAMQRLARFQEANAAQAVAVPQLLAAIRDRIAELDAARAEDGAIIARLQAELDAARAEARALGVQLEASRRGLEELSARFAAAVADLPTVAAAGGDK